MDDSDYDSPLQPVSVILLDQRHRFAIFTAVVAPVKIMLLECSVIDVLKEHST